MRLSQIDIPSVTARVRMERFINCRCDPDLVIDLDCREGQPLIQINNFIHDGACPAFRSPVKFGEEEGT